MAKISEQYERLYQNFNRIDDQMRSAPQDGQQDTLRTAARAIVRFEHAHELPRLKQLVADHGTAVSAIEVAKQKLTRLERSIAAQGGYIEGRFAEHDVTGDAIDLLAWELSARLGSQAVERLTDRALELEEQLHAFVRSHPGISDCLAVEREVGWDKVTRESFDWLNHEVSLTLASAAPEEVAA